MLEKKPHTEIRPRPWQLAAGVLVATLLAAGAASGQIAQIIDMTGDGMGNPFDAPPRTSGGIAVDGAGNVYLTGSISSNAFKITPGGVITEIIDSTGDGTSPLVLATGIAVDSAGNVYVAGRESESVFKIDAPGTCSTGGTPCMITEIINSSGDGSNTFDGPLGLAVDGSGNVYATGSNSDNAFKITPGGTITEIIDSTGDGAGNTLDNPRTIAVDGSGNVYVPGWFSDNAFQITPGGAITEIIDFDADDGPGGNNLDKPVEITVDVFGNVYLTAEGQSGTSDFGNAFRIATPVGCSTAGPACTITEIIDTAGDGTNPFRQGEGIAVDGVGNVYLTGFDSDNAFRIDTPGTCSTGGTPCTITELIDLTGDGTNSMNGPVAIEVDGSGNIYVSAFFTDNAFKIGGAVQDADGDGVDDGDDLCPGTAAGDPVDANGCSDAQVDGDGDGVCDPGAPSDGPSMCTGSDNCPDDSNPGQADFDEDGAGDVCDSDDDDDGDPDATDCDDFNPAVFTGAIEICTDGVDNDCDGQIDEVDAGGDCDADGVLNEDDNCPLDFNEFQEDLDDDGLGDVCDDDIDGDGVLNDDDNCPVNANPGQEDLDGDGAGDACDADADGDGLDDATDDLCLLTTTDPAAGVPSKSLGKNRWAEMDGNAQFDTNGKNPTGRLYTLFTTGGCNCAQIIEICGYGQGHTKFGCSNSVMDWWTGLYDRAGEPPYQCKSD